MIDKFKIINLIFTFIYTSKTEIEMEKTYGPRLVSNILYMLAVIKRHNYVFQNYKKIASYECRSFTITTFVNKY